MRIVAWMCSYVMALVAAGTSCVGEEYEVEVASRAQPLAQFAKWVADDTAMGDTFGRGLAMDGDVALIGSPYAGDAEGKAHVFVRRGGEWTQQALLIPPMVDRGDRFGSAVDIDGDTAVVAAVGDGPSPGSQQGAVYVFRRAGATWTEEARLTPSASGRRHHFGAAVALDGDTLLIGATGDNDWAGAVYVYTRSGSAWSQQAKLTLAGARAGDLFGAGVDLHGQTALVAAPGRDVNGDFSGAAYAFTRTGDAWSQTAELLPPDAAPYKWFGMHAVSLDDDTALIGCYEDDELRSNSGAVYVYTRDGGDASWSFQAKLKPSDPVPYGSFGWSTDIDGDTAVIGALYATGRRLDTGAAYVFTRSGSSWSEEGKLMAEDGVDFDRFGWEVAVAGNIVLINAESASPAGPYSGAVYGYYLALGCPAAGVGSWAYCSTHCLCGEGQGDCDAHDECAPGLRCLSDVGPSYGYADPEMDVCSALCPTEGLGSSRYCFEECPCDAGEGDCDSDAECASGLVCARDVGARYGYESEVDICEYPEISAYIDSRL